MASTCRFQFEPWAWAAVPITVDGPVDSSSILVEDDLGQLPVDGDRRLVRRVQGFGVDRPDGPCGAEAAAGANRRRNTGGSGGLPPDPTGGAAPGGPLPRTR